MTPYLILGSKNTSDRDDLIAVSDSFSWFAALFAPIWFLWRGMWLHAFLAFVAFLILGGVSAGFESMGFSLITQLALSIWFGLEARFYYIEHLQKQGAELLGSYMAFDQDMAIELYMDAHPISVAEHNTTSNIITSYDKAYHADMIFNGH